MFPLINNLRELVKTYHIFNVFDKAKAAEMLTKINSIREAIAIDADLRNIFWEQIEVPANATGYKQDLFFTRGDTRFSVNRGIANLTQDATVSLLHQGKRQNVITRNDLTWQQLFSDVQLGTINGQQTAFDFAQEIYFQNNETLNLGITGQTAAGQIVLHGSNFKDDYTPDVADIKARIAQSLPRWQIVPMAFQFLSATAGTPATGIDGEEAIYSTKSDEDLILTHVSVSNQNFRATLFDNGRSQELCETVEVAGIASDQSNQYTTYYPLPYPHLLRRQDRMKMRGVNGSLISGNEIDNSDGSWEYFTFAGFTA